MVVKSRGEEEGKTGERDLELVNSRMNQAKRAKTVTNCIAAIVSVSSITLVGSGGSGNGTGTPTSDVPTTNDPGPIPYDRNQPPLDSCVRSPIVRDCLQSTRSSLELSSGLSKLHTGGLQSQRDDIWRFRGDYRSISTSILDRFHRKRRGQTVRSDWREAGRR